MENLNSENEEVKISNKDFKNIENDMFNELNQSENNNEESNSSASGSNGQNEKINQSVQIPEEVSKIACGGISYLVHEKRIQTLPERVQNDAREVIKPTAKQIETMGTLATWFTDRYAPSLLNSPYTVPIMCTGILIKIEYTKFLVLSDIIAKSRES
jgi:hypothetical protein